MRHYKAAAILTSVLALASCGEDGTDQSAPSAPSADSTTESTSSVQVSDGDGASDADTDAGTGDLPEDMDGLDLEQRHPNGAVLRVTGISFTPTAMTVDVEAVNGFTQSIRLNDPDMQLVDDGQTVYNFVPPEDNTKLEVAPGGTLTGGLTFLGPLDRSATSLRLVVNSYDIDPINVSEEYDEARTPKFDIDDIPLRRS